MIVITTVFIPGCALFTKHLFEFCMVVMPYYTMHEFIDASLAQWLVRQSHNLKVVSSILTGGMFFTSNLKSR